MIIFMEGLDNVGKDTQIKNLLTYYANQLMPTLVLQYQAFKNISNKQSRDYSLINYLNMFRSLTEDTYYRCVTILNRSHISEFVYSPLYRNYSGRYVFSVENFYLKHIPTHHLFVFTDEPENLIAREDGYSPSIDLQKKRQEIKLFENAFKFSKLNKTLINITGKDEKMVFLEMLKELEQYGA